MKVITFKREEKIISEGEKDSSVFLIREGTVLCQKGSQFIRRMHKGESVGEFSILFETKRSIDVYADSDCICWKIDQESLKTVFEDRYKSVLFEGIVKEAIGSLKVLKFLTMSEFFSKVTDSLRLIKYSNKEIIYNEGGNPKLVIFVFGGLYEVF